MTLVHFDDLDDVQHLTLITFALLTQPIKIQEDKEGLPDKTALAEGLFEYIAESTEQLPYLQHQDSNEDALILRNCAGLPVNVRAHESELSALALVAGVAQPEPLKDQNPWTVIAIHPSGDSTLLILAVVRDREARLLGTSPQVGLGDFALWEEHDPVLHILPVNLAISLGKMLGSVNLEEQLENLSPRVHIAVAQ